MEISFSSIIYNNYIRSINFFLILSKKGCQGCHISKLGPRNFEICTSNWSILKSWSFGTNRVHGSCFDFVQSCACRNATSRTDESKATVPCTICIWENYQSNLVKTEVALQMMQSACPGFRNFVRLLKWIERGIWIFSSFLINISCQYSNFMFMRLLMIILMQEGIFDQ